MIEIDGLVPNAGWTDSWIADEIDILENVCNGSLSDDYVEYPDSMKSQRKGPWRRNDDLKARLCRRSDGCVAFVFPFSMAQPTVSPLVGIPKPAGHLVLA